ncbi:MAG: flavin reductase [Bacilli bacterium]
MKEYLNEGVNVVSYYKDNISYGMSCAWAMHCDYTQLLMLIGAQSDTGNNLKINDIVGVSVLAKGQEKIALHFGNNHSEEINKFLNFSCYNDGSALLIPGAKVHLVCKVINLSHVKGNDADHLVQLQILKTNVDEKKDFLNRYDVI